MLPRGAVIAIFVGCALSRTGLAQATQPASAPAATTQATQPTQTWTYQGGGQWAQKARTQPTTQLIDNPTLDKVDRLLARHMFNTARSIVLDWLKKNSQAPDRDRGLFLLAEAYYQYGDRTRAFYHLDELMDTYGESRLFYPALEKQYQIADAYLRGYKNRLFGLPIMGAEDDGIEMLFRIQERAPGSPLADRALLRTADYYYDNAEYDLAADAYGFYARRYPRSPLLARVLIRRAFASLAQFRGLNYDATPLVDAKAQLESFRVSFPELAEQENVPAVIERINATLAAKLLETGKFYERTHKPRSAAYTYRYLLSRYPDSRDAEKARGRIGRLPQWALNDPAPSPEANEEDVPLTGTESEVPGMPPATVTKPGPRAPSSR
jgi:outer membrane assembly lipoprotein YfiO